MMKQNVHDNLVSVGIIVNCNESEGAKNIIRKVDLWKIL